MKKLIVSLVLFAALFCVANAQKSFTFSQAANNGVDTTIFEVGANLGDYSVYAWDINADEVSGSDTVTVYLEEALDKSGTIYYRKDTATITSDGITRLSGTIYGERQRLYFISADADSTNVNASAYFR